jgi:hypothetical protein
LIQFSPFFSLRQKSRQEKRQTEIEIERWETIGEKLEEYFKDKPNKTFAILCDLSRYTESHLIKCHQSMCMRKRLMANDIICKHMWAICHNNTIIHFHLNSVGCGERNEIFMKAKPFTQIIKAQNLISDLHNFCSFFRQFINTLHSCVTSYIILKSWYPSICDSFQSLQHTTECSGNEKNHKWLLGALNQFSSTRSLRVSHTENIIPSWHTHKLTMKAFKLYQIKCFRCERSVSENRN